MAVSPESKYCQNVLTSALMYTDSRNWTPNGVRRVVLSADGVIVIPYLYKPVRKLFEPDKYKECCSSKDYQPMLSVLSGDGGARVFSHIEEIVICALPSKVSGNFLNHKEEDFINLAGSSKSSLSSLTKRFVRLRSISVVSDTLDTFWNFYISDEMSAYRKLDACLADSNRWKIRARNIFEFQSADEYYKHTAFRPQYYAADAENGRLRSTLEKLKVYLADKAVNEKVAKSKDRHMELMRRDCLVSVRVATAFLLKLSLLAYVYVTGDGTVPQAYSAKLSDSVYNGVAQRLGVASEAMDALTNKLGVSYSDICSFIGESHSLEEMHNTFPEWKQALSIKDFKSDSVNFNDELCEAIVEGYNNIAFRAWETLKDIFVFVVKNTSRADCITASSLVCSSLKLPSDLLSDSEITGKLLMKDSLRGSITYYLAKTELEAALFMVDFLLRLMLSVDFYKFLFYDLRSKGKLGKNVSDRISLDGYIKETGWSITLLKATSRE